MESDYHLTDKSIPTQPVKSDSESASKPSELVDTDDSTEQICDPHIFNGKNQ